MMQNLTFASISGSLPIPSPHAAACLHLCAFLSSLKKILLTGAFFLVILEIINKFYREVTSIMRKKRFVGRDPS